MTNKTINFTEKKTPTWQLAILGIIFIGGGLIAPMFQMLQGSEHAKKWNAYVMTVQPLFAQQDDMLNRMVAEKNGSKLPAFLLEAQDLTQKIKAIDGENEELDHIHNAMEKRAELLQEALEKLNTAKDPNSPETQKEIQHILIEAKKMIDEFKGRRDHYAKKYNFQVVDN